MKKRFLSLFLTLAMLVCVLPVGASAHTFFPGDCDYSVFKETIKEATCTEEGLAVYRCSNRLCWSEAQRSIPKLLHTPEVIPGKPATCTEDGLTDGEKCSVCGEITIAQTEIPAAHTTEVIPGKEATCTETGLTDGERCSVCRKIIVRRVITPTLGHDYSVLIGYVNDKAPTCTKGATAIYGCSRCVATENSDVPKLGHDPKVVEVFREPTCTQTGVQKSKCSREGCKYEVFEELDAKGHTEETVSAVAATCTATGLTEGKKCSVCDEVLVAQEVVPMVAHDWETYEAKEATCTEDGHSSYQECKNCHAILNKEVYKGGHQFENFVCTVCGTRNPSCEHENAAITVTNPTCTATGSKVFKCPDCGYEFTETLAMVAHKPVDKSVAATCTTPGWNHQVCKVCKTDVVKKEIPVIAHNSVNGTCTMCGQQTCNHSYKTTKTVSATCTSSGYKIETCKNCNHERTVEIPALGHNYVNGSCTRCHAIGGGQVTGDYQDIFGVFNAG